MIKQIFARSFTKALTAIQLNSAGAAWTICQESSRDTIKKVTLTPHDQRQKCSWRKKAECPMEGKGQVNDIVYKCDIARPLPVKVYLGFAEGEWKSRFYNHKLSLAQVTLKIS